MIKYVLNEVEEKAYRDFERSHYETCGSYIDAKERKRAKRNYVVKLICTPTGIGTIYKVQCSICGAVFDITDVDCW